MGRLSSATAALGTADSMIEWCCFDLEAQLYGGALAPARGWILVPQSPGLGMEPDPKVLRAYLRGWTCWPKERTNVNHSTTLQHMENISWPNISAKVVTIKSATFSAVAPARKQEVYHGRRTESCCYYRRIAGHRRGPRQNVLRSKLLGGGDLTLDHASPSSEYLRQKAARFSFAHLFSRISAFRDHEVNAVARRRKRSKPA
jgi:hypothetical protein